MTHVKAVARSDESTSDYQPTLQFPLAIQSFYSMFQLIVTTLRPAMVLVQSQALISMVSIHSSKFCIKKKNIVKP